MNRSISRIYTIELSINKKSLEKRLKFLKDVVEFSSFFPAYKLFVE